MRPAMSWMRRWSDRFRSPRAMAGNDSLRHRRNPQCASVRHGVTGIHGEVQQRHFELIGIGLRQRQIVGRLDDDPNLGPGRALDQSRDWTRGCSVTPKPDDRHLLRVFADALLKLVVDAGSEPSQIPHVGDAPGPMRHRYWCCRRTGAGPNLSRAPPRHKHFSDA